MKKINKQKLLKIISKWKLSQKVIDLTDKGLIDLAALIINYQMRNK